MLLIQQTSQVKYVGATLQDDLHWATHLGNLTKKLSHSIGLLSKIRHYVPKHLLRTLCYSLFNSHLIYAREIWGQNQTNHLFKKVLLLQEKAIRIINFQPQTSASNNLFKENRILKISDYINYKHPLFVRNFLRKKNLQIFNNMFTSLDINHTHNTRAVTNHLLGIPRKQTTHYETYSMTSSASVTWNDLLRNTSQNFVDCKITKFKRAIFQTYLGKYIITTKLQQNLSPVHYSLLPLLCTIYFLSFFISLLSLSYLLSFLFLLSFFFQRECRLIICLLSRSIVNAF